MKDQSQMMNQQQMLNLNQMGQSQIMNQVQMTGQPPQLMSQSQAMTQQPPLMKPPLPQMIMAQPPMMSRAATGVGGGYTVWSQQPSMDPNVKFQSSMKPNFHTKPSKLGRSNWKGKKITDKRNDQRRMGNPMPSNSTSGVSNTVGGYKPPTLNELQSQNRLKARKFFPKNKFNNRFAPYAPRNTTSFIIRAKKSGGIASLVSPYPVTPAVLPTPKFSPSREVLGDMAKEEWGVDGYGSMKGLIRLRSLGHEEEVHDEEEEEEGGGGSSESDVEEHVEVERRLDHDLSRFEMIYPNYGVEYNNVLGNRVDDQDTHIAQLEEENLTLKERLFLMEQELGDLRRRLQFLERQSIVAENVNEEVVENGSDKSEGGSDALVVGGDNNAEMVEYVSHDIAGGVINGDVKVNIAEGREEQGVGGVCMQLCVPEVVMLKENELKDVRVRNDNVFYEEKVERKETDEDGDTKLDARDDNMIIKHNDVIQATKDKEFTADTLMDRKDNIKDGSGTRSTETVTDEIMAVQDDEI